MTDQIWTLAAPADFSFHETLTAHGWRRLLPFHWDEDTKTLERVLQLHDGRVVLLTMADGADGTIQVTVSGKCDLVEIETIVLRMLQMDIPLDKFYAFCAERDELRQVPARCQGRLLVSPTVWEDYVKVVLTTNTTWAQTISMTARVVTLFGDALTSDPARHAFPTAAQVAAVPPAEWAERARLGYRAPSIHAAASQIAAGTLDLETLRDPALETGGVWQRLLALPGVGPYAAACLMIYLGRYERVNVDSWARTLVSKELGRPVTDKEAHAFFAPYGEWRALVYHVFPWRDEPDS